MSTTQAHSYRNRYYYAAMRIFGEDWKDEGKCVGQTDIFYNKDTIDQAKRVCEGCPVIETCLQFSIVAKETYGVWGGLSETERRRIMRTNERSLRILRNLDDDTQTG